MSDVESLDARTPTDGLKGSSEGVQDAIEDFVGRNVIKGRYLLAAVALAVAWWQTIGAMSAWVAGMGLVILSFTTPKVLAAVSSLRWPKTEGVVVDSAVLTEREAREYAGIGPSGGESETGYVPLIRYQFTVDGTTYESARVSPFDGKISRRRWARALVDRYPRNKHLSLRYDPADPTRSYLRPWVRSKYVLFLGIGAVFLVGAAWFVAGLPGGAPVLMTSIGLVAIAFGLYRFRLGFGSRNWPTADATVTATDISVQGGTEGSSTSYIPELHYEYEVDGTSYVGSRYSFGGTKDPGFDSRERARGWIEENCPVDARIPVHYDPDRPDVSVVEPGAWRSLILVLFGLVFLGGAVFFWFASGSALAGEVFDLLAERTGM